MPFFVAGKGVHNIDNTACVNFMKKNDSLVVSSLFRKFLANILSNEEHVKYTT